jgi:hypothetical protein
MSYLGLEGTISEKCNRLFELGKNIDVLQSHVIRFIESQKKRIEKQLQQELNNQMIEVVMKVI